MHETSVGSVPEEGLESAFTHELTLKGRKYRLYAKPFRHEPDENVDFGNRRPGDLNLLMITAEEVVYAEEIFSEATGYFLAERIGLFSQVMVATAGALLLLVLALSYAQIKSSVVDPIVKLTHFTKTKSTVEGASDQKEEKLNNFMEGILKTADGRQRRIRALVEEMENAPGQSSKRAKLQAAIDRV